MSTSTRKFGTFTGVFTPTLLTIFGVIMYVRLPWVMGHSGLILGFGIMAVAIGITLCTGLSLSSIATNTRIGDGGAYAIIQKSLGFEIGGSIGVPLYLTRPLGTAMYIFGFREGWLWIFPDHPAMLVDLSVFTLVFGLAYVGAGVVFKVQHFFMALTVASIVSILASPDFVYSDNPIHWAGSFSGTDIWIVFAVFFPATTGILAGTNMSGELSNPRRAIPAGTLWAIGVSTAVYFLLGYAALRMGTPDELVTNYNLFIDKAFWGPLVIAGLLGSTFSSALAGCLGGPRILMAMGEHKLFPGGDFLARKAKNGEPRNAILVTAALTLIALLLRDLNAIAPLLTMFFLITYGTLNVVLLVETRLGLVSFRPSLKVPWWVPLLGAAGSIFTMFVINPTFGFVSVGTVVAIYIWLVRRPDQGTGPMKGGDDIRSSMFVSVAEWASSKVSTLDQQGVRAWKPRLMLPITDPTSARGDFAFLCDVAKPEGTVCIMGLASGEQAGEEMRPELLRLVKSFRKRDVATTWTIVHDGDLSKGAHRGLQALQSAFFRPNLLFVDHPTVAEETTSVKELVANVKKFGVGALVFAEHDAAKLGQKEVINVWIREQSPAWGVQSSLLYKANINLLLLMGYRLGRSWKARINLVCVPKTEAERADAEGYLAELADLARMPKGTSVTVLTGTFDEAIKNAPAADLQILGLGNGATLDIVDKVVADSNSSVLLVGDSGNESALA